MNAILNIDDQYNQYMFIIRVLFINTLLIKEIHGDFLILKRVLISYRLELLLFKHNYVCIMNRFTELERTINKIPQFKYVIFLFYYYFSEIRLVYWFQKIQ